jgi:hypothetical protein
LSTRKSNDVEEQHKDRGRSGEDFVDWRLSLKTLWWCIPKVILTTALDGSLAQKDLGEWHLDIFKHYGRVPDTAEEDQDPWLLQSFDKHSLAIYLRQLVDDSGAPSTSEEFMQVITSLRIFVSYAIKDTAIVMAIDDQFKADRSSEAYVLRRRIRPSASPPSVVQGR